MTQPGALIGRDQLGNRVALTFVSDPGDPTYITMQVAPAPGGGGPTTGDNSISVVASDLISSAFRLINVLASGEPLETNMANDSLVTLQQMVDSWNADGLTIYTTRADDYSLVQGQQAYTLGPGGDFNASRPARIDGMSSILNFNPANPIEVPIQMYSIDDWQNKIPVKVVNGSFPQVCYDTGDFPLRTLNMWPIPTDSLNMVRIYSWQGLSVPSGLSTILAFPQSYAEAFRFNLSIRLAPEYGRSIPAEVATIAQESLGKLKTMNAPDLKLRSDLIGSEAGYNYKADLFGLGF